MTGWCAQAMYWEAEIRYELDKRDRLFRQCGIRTPDQLENNDSLAAHAGRRIKEHMDRGEQGRWHWMLLGVIHARTYAPRSSVYFGKALELSRNSPGALWLLFIEFDRQRRIRFAEQSLHNLYRIFLRQGAHSAPLVAQMLLTHAHIAEKEKRFGHAGIYQRWAQRFDRHLLWPTVSKMYRSLPFHLLETVAHIKTAWSTFIHSWLLQLALVKGLFSFLFFSAALFIGSVFAVLCLRHLPLALHPLCELFPESISVRFRTGMCIVAVLSLAFFGFLPFVWMLGFILWRFLSRREKVLGSVCLLLALCAPLSMRMYDRITRAYDPAGNLWRYVRAFDDGAGIAAPEHPAGTRPERGDTYLAFTADALREMKKGNYREALVRINKAEALAGDDPVVRILKGNVFYLRGEFGLAQQCYLDVIRKYPRHPSPYFNLGQYYFSISQTVNGMDSIAQADRLDPSRIASFVQDNDEFFAHSWPPNRRLLMPDYETGYFWKEVFTRYQPSWKSASLLWGAAFLGFGALLSFVIQLVLLAALLGVDVLIWQSNRLRDLAYCTQCGIPVCRRCKRGSLCGECYRINYLIRSKTIAKRMQMRTIRLKNRISALATLFGDILFPGAGMSVGKPAIPARSIAWIAVTSLVYGCYVMIFRTTYAYPLWIGMDVLRAIFILLVVYSVWFFISSIRRFLRQKRRQGI